MEKLSIFCDLIGLRSAYDKTFYAALLLTLLWGLISMSVNSLVDYFEWRNTYGRGLNFFDHFFDRPLFIYWLFLFVMVSVPSLVAFIFQQFLSA